MEMTILNQLQVLDTVQIIQKNISDKDLRLSYDNIFALNRIGTNEIVEEGKSLSLGFEYEKRNKKMKNFLVLSLANSISDKKNNNLPSKTKLNEKRTDIVGKFFFSPNKILNFDYSFSYDNNLKNSNYDSISTNINYNHYLLVLIFYLRGCNRK